jgi:hypothetical protein
MKTSFIIAAFLFAGFSSNLYAQTDSKSTNNLYLDVHHFKPGSVTYQDVASAHLKDLAAEKKFGVQFIKYWVDEADGNVYCLSSAPDSSAIRKTHAKAHGLLPDQIYLVNSGQQSAETNGGSYFLDIHHLGAGKVTAKDVAAAHQKDLAVEKKYGVNFINYWVNEKDGVVVCFSQAPDSTAIIQTHKEAHGLIPDQIERVKQGE